MDEGLAQECVRRLICIVLQRSGFDAASPDALVELEDKLLMREPGFKGYARQLDYDLRMILFQSWAASCTSLDNTLNSLGEPGLEPLTSSKHARIKALRSKD